jgi:2-amino-4-hydroxy-6-hydroxymethyldihydropteridine diphosphokinase
MPKGIAHSWQSHFIAYFQVPSPMRHSVTTTYLQLGTNLGDRLDLLAKATRAITRRCGEVVASSPIYETAAWGVTDQPDFLNQVLAVRTELAPQALLDEILAIEQDLGRERVQRWGSRLIDIDMLYYGTTVLNTPRLVLPHPWLHRRRFVLVPLADLAPGFVHPILGKSNAELLAALPDEGDVRPYTPQ